MAIHRPIFLSLVVIASLPGLLMAGHPALPGGASAEGSMSQSISSEGTYLNLYTDLAGGIGDSGLKPGDRIVGVSLRLDSSVSNFAGAFFERFDIRIGRGDSPIAVNFDDNFDGPPTTVRTGPLAILATDMSLSGTPHSFGVPVRFDNSWTYPGGFLAIEFRLDPNDSINIDVVNTSGEAGKVENTSDADATTGSFVLGPAWAIAFDVIRGGLPRVVNIAIPSGTGGEGDNQNGWAIPFTFQYLYPAADLSSLSSGDKILGVSLRLDQGETRHSSITFPRFDIRLGRGGAVFQNSSSNLFANNYLSPPTDVRSGPLTIQLPNSNSVPKPFGDFVYFETPYTYTGGNLVMEWRVNEGNVVPTMDFFNGIGARASNNADATMIDGPSNSVPALRLIVDKDYSALIRSLRNKIRNFNRRLRQARKRGQQSKVKRFQRKVRQFRRRIRVLSR